MAINNKPIKRKLSQFSKSNLAAKRYKLNLKKKCLRQNSKLLKVRHIVSSVRVELIFLLHSPPLDHTTTVSGGIQSMKARMG